MKRFLQAASFSVHHCRAPQGPRAAVPRRILDSNARPGSGGGEAGVGKEGVVSACTCWKGLSQKTVKSPLQEVGKTG